jgi:hypothetical protein
MDQTVTRRRPRSARHRRVAMWLMVAAGFGLLLAGTGARGGLDDPDPARQRPGILDGDGLPAAAPQLDGVPARGRPGVIFFVRSDHARALCREMSRGGVPAKAAVTVVVAESSPNCPPGVGTVIDGGWLAQRFGMPVPVDGGPAVGYALVDAQGRIRYRTLDPTVARHLGEVATMVKALG